MKNTYWPETLTLILFACVSFSFYLFGRYSVQNHKLETSKALNEENILLRSQLDSLNIECHEITMGLDTTSSEVAR